MTSNVISFEEEEPILLKDTSLSKARAVLLPIRKALFEGICRPFYEFLHVMRLSRHLQCADLARKISSELNLTYAETEENTPRE